MPGARKGVGRLDVEGGLLVVAAMPTLRSALLKMRGFWARSLERSVRDVADLMGLILASISWLWEEI